jgi:hypothetical protein
MSALDFANGRVNYNGNDFRGATGLPSNFTHDMSSYGTQQGQNTSAVSGNSNHYSYENAVSQPELNQNSMAVKSEDAGSATYGRPTLPNVDGMSSTQDSTIRWNNSFNADHQDNYLMTSSMASGPIPGKTSGVLTVNNF